MQNEKVQYAAWIGIDWGSDQHAVYLRRKYKTASRAKTATKTANNTTPISRRLSLMNDRTASP